MKAKRNSESEIYCYTESEQLAMMCRGNSANLMGKSFSIKV